MRNGELLNDELRHRKVTQKEAADAMGISIATFQRKLNDQTKCFTTQEAATIAKLLHLDSKTALKIFFD